MPACLEKPIEKFLVRSLLKVQYKSFNEGMDKILMLFLYESLKESLEELLEQTVDKFLDNYQRFLEQSMEESNEEFLH